MEFYNGNISQIQKFLQETPGKLSFTMNIWISPSAKAFLAITTHYIDKNWKLQNILVDFIQIFGSHSGENIKDAFVTGLQNLSIQNKVIFLFLFLLLI